MITRLAELNMYRVRGYEFSFTTNTSFQWHPDRDGSFLRLESGGGVSVNVNLTVQVPVAPAPPTGLRLWVEFYQGGVGSNTVNWPGTFDFQTLGDEVPNTSVGSTTIWTGIFGVGGGSCFMTKLGEWP